jgi:hypothetical protein
MIFIGNSPSSGSTLLADILDSSNKSACGPEIGLFSRNEFFRYKNQYQRIFKPGDHYGVDSADVHTFEKALSSYGLNQQSLLHLISANSSTANILKDFARRFLILRGKDEGGVVFEKTPQNLNTIDKLIDCEGSLGFISVVRDPLYSYVSLRKRGYSPYRSFSTWILSTARVMDYRNHKKCKIIRYEDLVKSPFEIASKMMKFFNLEKVEGTEFENGYLKNNYRKIFEKRVGSWSAKSIGKIVDGNKKNIDKNYRIEFSKFLTASINHKYAELYGLTPRTFTEICKHFRYDTSLIGDEKNTSSLTHLLSKHDRKYLAKKWIKRMFFTQNLRTNFNLLLSPLL